MKKIICLLATLVIANLAYAQGDAEIGKERAFTCMGCHGQDGIRNAYPAYRVPRLGGQGAEYISIALRAYRSGERSHPTMTGHAASLSDEDIDNIGAYFASIKND